MRAAYAASVGGVAFARTILQRVAEHCPVHETISTMDAIEFEFEGERGIGD